MRSRARGAVAVAYYSFIHTHFDLKWLKQNAAPYEGLVIAVELLNLSYVNVFSISLSIH